MILTVYPTVIGEVMKKTLLFAIWSPLKNAAQNKRK